MEMKWEFGVLGSVWMRSFREREMGKKGDVYYKGEIRDKVGKRSAI